MERVLTGIGCSRTASDGLTQIATDNSLSVNLSRVSLRRPPSRQTLLALLSAVSVVGCVAKPPERPIVLRPYHPERHVVHRHRPTPATEAASASDVAAPLGGQREGAESSNQPAPAATDPTALSAGEKEELFRKFDTYLSRMRSAP